MITENKKKILEWFYNKYSSGNKNFFQIKDISKDFHDISYLYIRILLVSLEEEGFIESIKTGKRANYFRCFRLNLDPQSKGGVYYLSRTSFKSDKK